MNQYRLSARGTFSKVAETLYESSENKSAFIFTCIEFYAEFHAQIGFVSQAVDFYKKNETLVNQIEKLSQQIQDLKVSGLVLHPPSNMEPTTQDDQPATEMAAELTDEERRELEHMQSTLGALLGGDDDES